MEKSKEEDKIIIIIIINNKQDHINKEIVKIEIVSRIS